MFQRIRFQPVWLVGLLIAALATAAFHPAQNPPPQILTPQMASAHYLLDWGVASEMSGSWAFSANYRLNQATVSQAAANNQSASAGYSLCTGWECGGPLFGSYVPVIQK